MISRRPNAFRKARGYVSSTSNSESHLILPPTRRVLSIIQKHGVKALLMGGQACVLYGAIEVTFDTDIAVLLEGQNIEALRRALAELEAEPIAVPPFDPAYLERGFFLHFRCFHADAPRQRLDVAAKMRGVAPFEELWERRALLVDQDGTEYAALGLADLVQSKKTQRDKDWPMIRRLLEADYRLRRNNPSELDVQFWLLEMRTPELLIELARDFPTRCISLTSIRPLLARAAEGTQQLLEREIVEEELAERTRDRDYWAPLKKELEELRRSRE
jgi:hypothetical protein